FSQSEDLAASRPEKLRELQERFLVEAGRYHVLPLDDRFAERMDSTLRPSFFAGRNQITLFPGMGGLPEGSAPKTININHAIDVIAEIPRDGAEGFSSVSEGTPPAGAFSSWATGFAITTTGLRW